MSSRLQSYKMWPQIGSPYSSELGPFLVSLYVSGAVDEYAKIRPDEHGSHAQMPVGVLIVREVFDNNQKVARLTVMGKGPAGYDPQLGDWWFAVTDPRGTPAVENGLVQTGKLTACHGCHSPRSQDDFLYGYGSNIAPM